MANLAKVKLRSFNLGVAARRVICSQPPPLGLLYNDTSHGDQDGFESPSNYSLWSEVAASYRTTGGESPPKTMPGEDPNEGSGAEATKWHFPCFSLNVLWLHQRKKEKKSLPTDETSNLLIYDST